MENNITPNPIVLFDVHNNILPLNIVITTHTLFVRSIQNFKIELISDNIKNQIYSVKENPIVIDKSRVFTDNFFYTIYFESTDIIRITSLIDTNFVREYNVTLNLPNLETTELYKDLLTNYLLPDYAELEPAIISQNKAEMIKRLLLDYKQIMNKKGTTESIVKFLNLIGFNPESIKVYPEFKDPITNDRTLTPNTEYHIKTGYYHILFDNWITDVDDEYTTKNLPKRIINIDDLEEFFQRLFYAIALANKYFTIQEQDISFFGLNNSANVERYLSITGNTSIVFDDDVHSFRKSIYIDIFNNETSIEKKFIVKNKYQLVNNIFKTEVKANIENQIINDELFIVNNELFDDEEITETELSNIISTFGNIIYLQLTGINVYCDYTIEDITNPLTKIIQEQFFIEDLDTIHTLKFLARKTSTYRITIIFFDLHNNREKYVYNVNLTNDVKRIDFDIFNSVIISSNGIIQDIDSGSETTDITLPSYNILSVGDIPLLLSEYFNSLAPINRLQLKNSRYILPSINYNEVVNDVTETLPLGYFDNWLDVIGIPFKEGHKLIIRDNLSFKNYYDPSVYPNNLFITVMDIFETHDALVKKPYVFITTTEPGVDIKRSLYDLYWINEMDYFQLIPCDIESGEFDESHDYTFPQPAPCEDLDGSFDDSFGIEFPQPLDEEVWNDDLSFDETFDASFTTWDGINSVIEQFLISIYDVPELTRKKIPVNYDFPLFFNETDLVDIFVNHPDYVYDGHKKIESVFPRLNNIRNGSGKETYNLMIGDIIVCGINKQYITEMTDIEWKIFNGFTNELLFETNDLMLKYRVNQKVVYNITLKFKVDGVEYILSKNSIQSSFII